MDVWAGLTCDHPVEHEEGGPRAACLTPLRWPLDNRAMGVGGRTWFALAALVLFVACGGGGGDDVPADAGPPDAYMGPCPFPPGFSHVMTEMRFQPADVGADLDGDGDIDNAIGHLPSIVLGGLHDGLDDAIAVGEWMMIFHATEVDIPPAASDADLGFHVFTGLDVDVPPDPSNNYGGDGRLYARIDEFDIDCNSITEADQAAMVDYVLTAEKQEWSWALGGTSGTMSLVNGSIVITYASDFRTATGLYTGMTPICSMAHLPFPGETPGSVLDSFVNDLEPFVSVDMDLDGDGLEQVIGDGETVLECHDGDGTLIPGQDCPCDPRIVDAYSLAFAMKSVTADIIGVK